jgi:TPP-dependent pyruvate/acetoin dehydrogenase alpha subunit
MNKLPGSLTTTDAITPPDPGSVTSVPAITQLSDHDLDLMLMIRHFEQAVLGLFAEGALSGTAHTCIGQEYVPVALAAVLHADDFVFSNHRSHGHYLARYADPAGLLAEIMGRSGAICRGVGGSQHLYRERFLSTGIQGQSLPVATGVALHFRKSGQRRLAVAYIGDGTWGQGIVYEALNMAALWRLPLLVVVENNGIAQSTPTAAQMSGTIEDRARAFGLNYTHVRTDSVDEIRRLVIPLAKAAREGPQPAVVEFQTGRLGPHSKGDDTRAEEDLRRLRDADWCVRYERSFPGQFRAADDRQREHIRYVVRQVAGRPLSDGWPDGAVTSTRSDEL